MDWTLVGTCGAAALAAIVSYVIWPKDRRSLRKVRSHNAAAVRDAHRASDLGTVFAPERLPVDRLSGPFNELTPLVPSPRRRRFYL
jgi:hypothetical protein